MAEFTLPKNSKISVGKTWPKPEGAKNLRAFKIYRWNEESGETWMQRLLHVYPKAVWLNPVPEGYWETTPSVQVMKQIMSHRMFPMTLDGLERAMKELSR